MLIVGIGSKKHLLDKIGVDIAEYFEGKEGYKVICFHWLNKEEKKKEIDQYLRENPEEKSLGIDLSSGLSVDERFKSEKDFLFTPGRGVGKKGFEIGFDLGILVSADYLVNQENFATKGDFYGYCDRKYLDSIWLGMEKLKDEEQKRYNEVKADIISYIESLEQGKTLHSVALCDTLCV